MVKEDKKADNQKSGDKCECCSDKKCDCGCGCCCGCKCGCAKKLFKLFVLVIVFLAGVGCGCIMCCSGCKSQRYHRMPAHIAMAKHMRHQPKNNVIVIRTDGDEVVPEVAGKVNPQDEVKPQPEEMPAVEVPAEKSEAPAEEAKPVSAE